MPILKVYITCFVLAFSMACKSTRPTPQKVVSDYSMSLEGRVMTSGAPVEDASVELELLDSHSFLSSRTDPTGHFRFDGLVSRKPVPFVLTVTKNGFDSRRVDGSWPEEGPSDPDAKWPATKVHQIELRKRNAI